VAVAGEDALIVGAFQRAHGMPKAWPLARRGSGGPEVRVGTGTVHVALALAHPGALVPCDERRIVNRSVRPLLRALTKTSKLAHFFGRDWVSVAHRPAAWVGFAHDAGTRRTLFEAFVAVRTPFALADRPSFLGKPQGTLEEIGRQPLDPRIIADAIADAYLAAYNAEPVEITVPETWPPADDLRADPPWAATCDEAIGIIGAGPDAAGVFRVGGDLLVSRDALAELEERVAAASTSDIRRIVDDTLGRPGVAIDGVRSLASVAEVIESALSAPAPPLAPTRAPL